MVLPLLVLPAGAVTVSTAADFDGIPVETDLAGTTIGGVKFDPARYGYNPLGSLQVLTLLEYSYPDDPALYLYLYNPQDLALSMRDRRYAVTLALGGEAESYTKYPLEVLSMSGTDAHSRLWIKCRIDVGADKLITAYNGKPGRTYRLGEVELVIDSKVKSYGIGGEWTYTGTTAGGDLTSDSTMISVIELDLNPLVYRGDASTGSDLFLHDQVDSVYFAIPKDFEEENGTITSIRCTWTEYDSGWILACKTKDVYELLSPAAGKTVIGYDKSYPKIFAPSLDGSTLFFGWNCRPSSQCYLSADVLQWVVKYDQNAESGSLVASDLKDQIGAMWNAYCGGADNYFSTGGETKIVDILKDQNFSVKVDDGSAWWQQIFSKNHGVAEQDGQAFQRVTRNALSDPEKNLLVDKSYKNELVAALTTADARDEDLMVLHFASSQYRSIPVKGQGYLWDDKTWVNDGKEDMFACKEQVYMGFDIIQFTCEKDGERVVVPVAASPVNAIGDLQFFDGIKDSFKKWVIILIAIILIVVVLFLCPALLPILVKVVVLPFKLLWWLIKALGRGISGLIRSIKDRKK